MSEELNKHYVRFWLCHFANAKLEKAHDDSLESEKKYNNGVNSEVAKVRKELNAKQTQLGWKTITIGLPPKVSTQMQLWKQKRRGCESAKTKRIYGDDVFRQTS